MFFEKKLPISEKMCVSNADDKFNILHLVLNRTANLTGFIRNFQYCLLSLILLRHSGSVSRLLEFYCIFSTIKSNTSNIWYCFTNHRWSAALCCLTQHPAGKFQWACLQRKGAGAATPHQFNNDGNSPWITECKQQENKKISILPVTLYARKI